MILPHTSAYVCCICSKGFAAGCAVLAPFRLKFQISVDKSNNFSIGKLRQIYFGYISPAEGQIIVMNPEPGGLLTSLLHDLQ